jgi:hypothetical protein
MRHATNIDQAIQQRRHPGRAALDRLLHLAERDTGQARRIADFLLAWHNAADNGRWDPVDLWNVDNVIADDMLKVLQLVRDLRVYPDQLGLSRDFEALWRRWRSA